jgi:hypothetical protein
MLRLLFVVGKNFFLFFVDWKLWTYRIPGSQLDWRDQSPKFVNPLKTCPSSIARVWSQSSKPSFTALTYILHIHMYMPWWIAPVLRSFVDIQITDRQKCRHPNCRHNNVCRHYLLTWPDLTYAYIHLTLAGVCQKRSDEVLLSKFWRSIIWMSSTLVRANSNLFAVN